jgi:hypothetical protein
VVRLSARFDMRFVQLSTLARQVASRTWLMRTTDFSAWKKDWEVCMRALVKNSASSAGEGLTWRRREKGRHAWKESSATKLEMKLGQDCTVKFAPRVLSKGIGSAELWRGVAAATLEEATLEVDEGLPFVVDVGELPLMVESVNSCRRASSGSKLSNCQAIPAGGGR